MTPHALPVLDSALFAPDAAGIATDIGPALKRGQRASKANYGLA